MMANRLDIWVVFDHPLDYPNHFVVRCQSMVPGTAAPEMGEPFVADTLEGVRAFIPHGLTWLDRHPLDDPKILETWI